ncbi:hypothetical protein MLD38_004158 [Melastoma candidum]|uniref:Uncharacterized protein n=1 Tax=Melastoma candidum TaxID=119954 RepID=A0ACB9S420_9MYRT|nr:hypothetical protein MLD38_004158 [Melastoma candidum]
MEEREFKRVLALFPVVRSRDFRADQDSSGQSTSGSLHDDAVQEWHDTWDQGDKNEQSKEGIDQNDVFWEKLKLAVENKVGHTAAENFCQAFQQSHKKLVYEVLSVDAAKKFINSSSAGGRG